MSLQRPKECRRYKRRLSIPWWKLKLIAYGAWLTFRKAAYISDAMLMFALGVALGCALMSAALMLGAYWA